jgi:LPPG:FO 2-phospho-L-lactate transferase
MSAEQVAPHQKPITSAGKVLALAGGVGGARLAAGLAQALPPGDLTVIVNIGDDFDHLGLRICPDMDTVCYTLAGLENLPQGWGRSDETWKALESLSELIGKDWFKLGDRDLGTHLARTHLLRSGLPLSQVTQRFCQVWGITTHVLPASDDHVPTIVLTSEGELPFQEYFVHRQCQPQVTGFRFDGVDSAQPAPGVVGAIAQADLIVFCPSNPWVSLDPILAVPGIYQALKEWACLSRPLIAISPIIQGATVRGPAAKMFTELGLQPSALAVAQHYAARRSGGWLTGFVIDQQDRSLQAEIEKLGMWVLVTDTIMRSRNDRLRLAQEILTFKQALT